MRIVVNNFLRFSYNLSFNGSTIQKIIGPRNISKKPKETPPRVRADDAPPNRTIASKILVEIQMAKPSNINIKPKIIFHTVFM